MFWVVQTICFALYSETGNLAAAHTFIAMICELADFGIYTSVLKLVSLPVQSCSTHSVSALIPISSVDNVLMCSADDVRHSGGLDIALVRVLTDRSDRVHSPNRLVCVRARDLYLLQCADQSPIGTLWRSCRSHYVPRASRSSTLPSHSRKRCSSPSSFLRN